MKNTIKLSDAKKILDALIQRSRIHLYKPIQVAEILYRDRVFNDIDLLDVETYRNSSKKWRDEISLQLLNRRCTSSAKFQDNLFENNAVPPAVLNVLGIENRRTKGAVEAYIYSRFENKHLQLGNALDYCLNATKENFVIKDFINLFWEEPGLKRSLDKIYEIIVYALFSVLVSEMELEVQISINENKLGILSEFEDFAGKIMCLDTAHLTHIQNARIYRVGVTNAADRGLDMYSNWGPAIQIKHLSLNVELAQNITDGISSDRIVIVCKEAEEKVIVSLLTQIGWKSKIQSIVTEQDLITWYEKALRGKYSQILGTKLLGILAEEIANEFPSVDTMPKVLLDRQYKNIKNDFWK